MFFLSPLLLWFLAAASVPVIIHLINRRRHKTIQWAAMQFLLKAARESRGKKKLRHILILTCRALGIAEPRIAVAGLNPHASECGLFGNQEAESILPAIAAARTRGLDVSDPQPPDTVFLRATKGHYDIVVAQYHDQGHIPMKLLAFDSGVNVSYGLPVIRTSVDHGTAFDIAGKGIASESSMLAAIDVALQMVRAKAAGLTS